VETELTESHRQTYESVFQHPVARNLLWRDVRTMLGALHGLEQEEHDGTLKVKRNGRTLVLHRPYRKNVADVAELMQIRRFLEHSQEKSPRATEGTRELE
jgi:hypothetical protein